MTADSTNARQQKGRAHAALLAFGIASMLAPVASVTRAADAQAAVPSSAGVAVNASGPYELIDSASQIMLQNLEKNRDAYRKDPTKLYRLVDDVLLPHFDTDYAARLVLGKSWRTASPDQRKRFVDSFYKSLLRTYGDALLEFTSDRMKVFPLKVEPSVDKATVRTEVTRSSGDRVPVNYSLHKTEGGWKAWDVTIEGISYVKSFREDFASEIDQKGLDAVIHRLESGDYKAPSANQAGKKAS
jgi:phospholipid transport system substrate-binding protein